MEKNETQKIGFWKRIKMSIFNVENYDIFAVEKFSKALGYFIKLMIIFSLIVAIGLTYRFTQIYTKAIDLLKNEIPDFQYTQGNLTVYAEDAVIIENNNGILSKIIIDDTEDVQKQKEYQEEIKKYETAMLFLKNGVFINLSSQEEPIYYEYQEIMKQFGIEEFTKEQMVNYIDAINVTSLYASFYLTTAIYVFSTYIILIFLDVILLSILGLFTSRIAKIKLKYTPIVNISIYALTLSIILYAIYMIINMIIGFEIQYFRVMYNAIAYIYVVTAILMIRAEMIKQQIELARLIEEQKKVREELEQKEEKENEEQKKKEEEPKDKKQEKKEENDDAVDGSGII